MVLGFLDAAPFHRHRANGNLMRARRFFTVSGAVVATAALAGCSSTIDSDKAESEIQKGIERQSSGQIPVKAVDCPDDVEAKKGDTFQCTVTGDNGKTGPVTVVQKDDEGNVTYSGNLQALVQG
jgi:outer membrane murein-binding lipoprotein Lpp